METELVLLCPREDQGQGRPFSEPESNFIGEHHANSNYQTHS